MKRILLGLLALMLFNLSAEETYRQRRLKQANEEYGISRIRSDSDVSSLIENNSDPTTLLLYHNKQAPMAISFNSKGSYTGKFDLPQKLTAMVEIEKLRATEDGIQVGILVSRYDTSAWVLQEFSKLLRGKRTTNQAFLELLSARGYKSARLELPEDGVGLAKLKYGRTRREVPSIGVLLSEVYQAQLKEYEKQLEDYEERLGQDEEQLEQDEPDFREKMERLHSKRREWLDYKENVLYKTVTLKKGEVNDFELVTGEAWDYEKTSVVKAKNLSGRFDIVKMKRIPDKTAVEPKSYIKDYVFESTIAMFGAYAVYRVCKLISDSNRHAV